MCRVVETDGARTLIECSGLISGVEVLAGSISESARGALRQRLGCNRGKHAGEPRHLQKIASIVAAHAIKAIPRLCSRNDTASPE
jgi:hypothetical protein